LLSGTAHNETNLLELIAEGDEKAFRQLVHQYADLLGSHIYRITHSREQTEEIVQDVFLKIWMTRESLSDVRNFRTYLYVISRNHALNALQSLIREKTKQKEWQKSVLSVASSDDNLDTERLSLLDQAIAQLPAQQQKAWILSRQERMKYHEIAKEMGLTQETVRKYVKLASISITKYMETHIGMLLLGIFLKNNF
jgi:RNA polymerase sigma-70 factor (family 1)